MALSDCSRDSAQRSRSVSSTSESAAGRHVVGVGVEREEAVGVPQRLEVLAHRLADRLDREAVAVPRLLRGEVVPPERVRAVGVEHVPGRDGIALGLRHLLALGVGDQAQAEHGLERRPAVQQRGHRQQRVEPATRLVQSLADVVGREALLEGLLVLERCVPLGEGHRARVPPHVDQVGHPPEGLAVALERGVVHIRAVQVGRTSAPSSSSSAREPTQTVSPSSARQIGSGVPQYRSRLRRPVDVVLEPVAEAPVLDVLGVPGHGLVGGQQLVLDLGGAHVPGRLGVVQERGLAAPAVRVAVLVVLGAHQLSARAQLLDDVGVGVLDLAPGVGAHALVEGPVTADGVLERQALLFA